MTSFALSLVAIGIAIFIGNLLYLRGGSESQTVGAGVALVGSVFWLGIGIYLILGGMWYFGIPIVILFVYLSRGNARTLQEDNVRQRLAG